mmetsp:Transcript_30403/g.76433  ORF Transcript_30403/g.76433 Transcript_30403/m.76433 type:complete len:264 (+) Transcript_30403:110-901(+)
MRSARVEPPTLSQFLFFLATLRVLLFLALPFIILVVLLLLLGLLLLTLLLRAIIICLLISPLVSEAIVSCNQKLHEALIEGLDDVLAARMREFSVQHGRIDAEPFEEDLHFIGCLDAFHKYERLARHKLKLQQRVQYQPLVRLVTEEIELREFTCDSRLLEFEEDRLVQHQTFQRLHFFGECGGNQHGLVGGRHHGAQSPHVLFVTEGEHEIGLVHDEDLQGLGQGSDGAMLLLDDAQEGGRCRHEDRRQLRLRVLIPSHQRL